LAIIVRKYRAKARLDLSLVAFACQLFPSQSTARSGLHRVQESALVALLVLALIEAEGLFVEVAEKMERLNVDVCAFDRALQE